MNDTTIFELIPELNVENLSENRRQALEVQEFLREHGKENCNLDEVVFIIMLDHYIKVFEKAKTMLAKDRFVVKYKPSSEKPDLKDFFIETK